jgi:hypothetical protein
MDVVDGADILQKLLQGGEQQRSPHVHAMEKELSMTRTRLTGTLAGLKRFDRATRALRMPRPMVKSCGPKPLMGSTDESRTDTTTCCGLSAGSAVICADNSRGLDVDVVAALPRDSSAHEGIGEGDNPKVLRIIHSSRADQNVIRKQRFCQFRLRRVSNPTLSQGQ